MFPNLFPFPFFIDYSGTWHHQETATPQTEKALSGSCHSQPGPRRRVQRRCSVTAYNLDDSMKQVQKEEEDLVQANGFEAQRPKSMVTRAQSVTHSIPEQPASYAVRHENPKTKKSRSSLKRLRQFFRRRSPRPQPINEPMEAAGALPRVKTRRPFVKTLLGFL
jgi:hypothetical protein